MTPACSSPCCWPSPRAGEGAVLRLPPVDRCAADDTFVAFRARAASRRLPAATRVHVLAIVADDIMVNFGGGAGREEFARDLGARRAGDEPALGRARRGPAPRLRSAARTATTGRPRCSRQEAHRGSLHGRARASIPAPRSTRRPTRRSPRRRGSELGPGHRPGLELRSGLAARRTGRRPRRLSSAGPICAARSTIAPASGRSTVAGG